MLRNAMLEDSANISLLWAEAQLSCNFVLPVKYDRVAGVLHKSSFILTDVNNLPTRSAIIH
jgi:hypothetical protein